MSARGTVATLAVVGLGAAWTPDAAAQTTPATTRGEAMRSLLRATAIPPGYRPIGELAGRGQFYANGAAVPRLDDGGTHHTGAANTASWAALRTKGHTGHGPQGAVYRVEDGVITGAGYLIRQTDLAAGKSFRGLTFRELPFPAAQALTIDLIKGSTPDTALYLWLWHFLPLEGSVPPMLPYGELPPLATLPATFEVIGRDAHPKAFYPRMGRHRRVAAHAARRAPSMTGNESVQYGEAAGKLVFIEYIFSQDDFVNGASWSTMPLNGLPIPPLDNLHVMHYEATPSAPAYFTAHMYFVPEEVYLSWETEPATVGRVSASAAGAGR